MTVHWLRKRSGGELLKLFKNRPKGGLKVHQQNLSEIMFQIRITSVAQKTPAM